MTYDHPISIHAGKRFPDSKFSILIPTWNNLEMLKICVSSILKNSSFSHEIIIHVNEGIDGTWDWVKENGYSYTHSTQNVGVCYAMNAMAKLATTDYILYINDDMYVCPAWDVFLNDAIKEAGNPYFYFSATMIEPFGNKNKCAITPFNFGISPETFKEAALLEFIKTVEKGDWYGATWPPSIVHRKLWDEVGGYSVAFSPGFGSDPDFSMKLWQAGVRNFKGLGKSLVYHFQSKSTDRVTPNNGRLQFAQKWGLPASYFYKEVLKLGNQTDGTVLKMPKNTSYLLAKLRAIWIKWYEGM
ncbi:MAG: glycosyltransferase [Saprospiraceae bacterium]|nr:glycosyltransferase [Saprospiraceae bacterium]